MQWLLSIDTGLFRLINGSLGNPLFDWLMPVLSGNGVPWFIPLAVLGLLVALVRGPARVRVCAVMIILVISIGDPLVINSIKHFVARPRPCLVVTGAVARLGCTESGSMPSAHAANWFAMTTVLFRFYRRSWRFMLPLAAGVAFSRVYCGVHYPSDVLAGALLGVGYAAGLLWVLETLWGTAGARWFPAWHRQMPSLAQPPVPGVAAKVPTEPNSADGVEWLRLSYGVIILLLVGRWWYLTSGYLSLSEDEAYQWLWSKHLALSYYSKPPGIAYLQFLGTQLWGDNTFGVRFFSPLMGAVLGLVTVRFMAREVGAQPAFWLLLMVTATPLLNVGAVLLTIDPPLVLFWTTAMITGWQALKPDGGTKDWLLTGLLLGLGFLFKYTAMLQIVCWAIFFGLSPAYRRHLTRPGPWLALGVFLLCTLPVLIWNAQHHWITVVHVAGDAGLHSAWKPTLNFLIDFTAAELGLLNPVFFVGALWAAMGAWRLRRENPLYLYLFCMGAPVFLGHWLYALHSRVLPNWPVVSVLPLFCLMVAYGSRHARWVRPWLAGGLALGLLAGVLMYDTDLLGKLTGNLPGEIDPSHRVRAWVETAAMVETEREKFATNGAPCFIIAHHYGLTGLLSLYSPPARAALKTEPLVYCVDSDQPQNQFYFWPEYDYRAHRQGQNALYVSQVTSNPYENGWFWHWLRHEPLVRAPLPVEPVPARMAEEFESVQDLGVREVVMNNRVFHRLHFWGCYHLKARAAAPMDAQQPK